MNDCTVWARDAFSFWAPLDQQFLNALSNSSYWKQTLFFSPFRTKSFYAYLDYNQVSGETSQQIHTQLDEAALAAMNNNQFKPVHQQCAGLSHGDRQRGDGGFSGIRDALLPERGARRKCAFTVDASYLGYSGAVNLGVSGLPAGACADFSAGSIHGGSAASKLTVSAGASTPLGSDVLRIIGSGGSFAHSTPVTLTVTGAARPN